MAKTKKKATAKKAVSKKAASRKAVSRKASAKDDQRKKPSRRKSEERREKEVPVASERRYVERRKVQRRRQIDPTTCERDYSPDEIEFMRALDIYKRASGRMFPTCSEILEVLGAMGYQRVGQCEGSLEETIKGVLARANKAAAEAAANEKEKEDE